MIEMRPVKLGVIAKYGTTKTQRLTKQSTSKTCVLRKLAVKERAVNPEHTMGETSFTSKPCSLKQRALSESHSYEARAVPKLSTKKENRSKLSFAEVGVMPEPKSGKIE